MRPLYDFLIRPYGDRYNNSKKVGDKDLILNTEMFNHQYINREAIIDSIPVFNPHGLRKGDRVLVHHNVFRRWHNIKGVEKNSRSFLSEEEYLISEDQIFMYKRDDAWACMKGYTFVKPIKATDDYSLSPEKPLVGLVKYSDGTFLPTQLVGFSPGDEFEFVVDGERLYRVMNRCINIEYEYKGNEEEYNPSWA
jgi:hypothetical protein|tara:strand:+ start:4568 stop:5149 length:582 start_codon:yes stop_codon:yes gene_type:complete